MRLYATSSLKGFQGGGSAEPLVCLREKDIFERRESDTTGVHRSFLKLSPDRSMNGLSPTASVNPGGTGERFAAREAIHVPSVLRFHVKHAGTQVHGC